MRLNHDTLSYLQFALHRKHPELFAALHRMVEEALDDLKHAHEFPPDTGLYRVLLDFDVRPQQEIMERRKQLAALHQHLKQMQEAAYREPSIEY
jgi:hypothetical protein